MSTSGNLGSPDTLHFEQESGILERRMLFVFNYFKGRTAC